MPNFQIIENYFNSLTTDIVIEAEIHPKHRNGFESQYREVTVVDVPTPIVTSGING